MFVLLSSKLLCCNLAIIMGTYFLLPQHFSLISGAFLSGGRGGSRLSVKVLGVRALTSVAWRGLC